MGVIRIRGLEMGGMLVYSEAVGVIALITSEFSYTSDGIHISISPYEGESLYEDAIGLGTMNVESIEVFDVARMKGLCKFMPEGVSHGKDVSVMLIPVDEIDRVMWDLEHTLDVLDLTGDHEWQIDVEN